MPAAGQPAMKVKINILLACAVAGIGAAYARSLTIDRPAYLSKLEIAVLQELNLARSNPQTYAKLLEDYRNTFEGKLAKRPGQLDLLTNEGTEAVDEAISALKSQAAIGTLRPSKGMSLAAKDHAKDTGPKGITGHAGADGSNLQTRLNRHGKWDISIAENISYGMKDGRAVIIQLIVDDGVSSRGHRTNIFNDKYARVGVACGPHKVYEIMCVQTFAGEYTEK